MASDPTVSDMPSPRVPPHSAEAERGVLGSILLDASRVLDLCAANGLSDPLAFYIPAHRIVYEAMLKMSSASGAIDILTVAEVLRTAGTLDQVGGAAFLEQLVDTTPTAAHAEYYIGIVREKFLLRRILGYGTENAA